MIEFVRHHEDLFLWLTIASVIFLIVSPLIVSWMVIQLPSDYFSYPTRQKYQWDNQVPIIRWGWIFLKNIFGVMFVIGGIAMLVLPGQGILTIIVGLFLMDFPYKYKVESWIIKRTVILKTVNRLRVKAKRDTLKI